MSGVRQPMTCGFHSSGVWCCSSLGCPFCAKRSSATRSFNVGTACAESREQSRSGPHFTAAERDAGPRSETEVGLRVYSVCVWYTGHGALLKSLTCVWTSLETELADPNLTQVLRGAVGGSRPDFPLSTGLVTRSYAWPCFGNYPRSFAEWVSWVSRVSRLSVNWN